MVKPFEFAVDTDLSLGLKALLQQLEQRLGLRDVLGKARQWRLAKPAA